MFAAFKNALKSARPGIEPSESRISLDEAIETLEKLNWKQVPDGIKVILKVSGITFSSFSTHSPMRAIQGLEHESEYLLSNRHLSVGCVHRVYESRPQGILHILVVMPGLNYSNAGNHEDSQFWASCVPDVQVIVNYYSIE